ncbi:hypothetical protein ACIA8O_16290 [Kitasatospora sp. NPDC051853]|uniref:hypothetical protein n=1 Tax=Kitasatospora sp. NPDC051853 TaxID=3364058 RepID=UPI0037BC6026
MPSRPRRSAALLLALPLLLLLPAGCAGTDADPSRDAAAPTRTAVPPQVPAVPVLDSANDRPLPLDAYLLAPAQLLTVQQAQARLTTACMTRFGFDFAPPQPSPPPRDSDAPTTRVDGRYGPQNAAAMAKWGYHPEGGDPGAGAQPPRLELSPEMTTALRGASDPRQKYGPGGQSVNGRTVPDRGCVGEAVRTLTGSADGRIGDAQLAEDLKFRTLVDSQKDARTAAVFARWSECMKESGFDYPDPVAALGDKAWQDGPTPSPRELRVATADAACRHRTNLVGVWYSVDSAYQERAIAENAAAMAQIRTALHAQVDAATAALKG